MTRTDYDHRYDPSEASTAGGGDRQMEVRVLGNPFGTPPEALGAAVIDVMQRSSFVPVNFAARPGNPDPERNVYVVLAFEPDRALEAERLCGEGGPVETHQATGKTTTLMGAYCLGNRYLSRAIARADDVGGIETEKFRGLVSQMTLALFPTQNPHDDEGDSSDILPPR